MTRGRGLVVFLACAIPAFAGAPAGATHRPQNRAEQVG